MSSVNTFVYVNPNKKSYTRIYAKKNDPFKFIEKGIKNHNKECGYMIIKFISSFLPHADTIGHKILHANNEFIAYIINLDEKVLPHKLKSQIVLLTIKIAQMGDEFGGHILQMYYDIVKKCFDDGQE